MMELTSKAPAARVTRVEDNGCDDQDGDEDNDDGGDATPRHSTG